MMQPSILLIEDDRSTASALEKVLSADGYSVNVSARGDDGLVLARDQ
jgi:DNA-binding response OmpR family regulator